ncbi:MAG TPA: hypothetical protein VMY78_06680 [Solirubrobacteraceae bacterium]|nr:hypothetical protein [Solirubrobacteraceae bacterium]
MSARMLTAAAVVAALALPAGADATAGAVDARFGTGGLAATPFGSGARAAAVALAPDGRLLVAGDVRSAGGERVLTARFGATGVLDPTFAPGGGRTDSFGSGEPGQRARAVLAQADGGTLVAAAAGDQLALARLDPDGRLDGLFGAGGVALRDPSGGGGVPPGTGPAAIAVMADGRIVVAGSVGVETDDGVPGEQIVVGRTSDRGVPDPSFGGDGFVVLQLGAASPRAHAASAARALGVLADGRIVIAGRATSTVGEDRAFVARLTPAGALDASFAAGGRRLLQLGRASAARAASSAFEALVLEPDGSVLAAGRASDVAGGDAVALTRLGATGALAARFGRNGTVSSQLGAGAGDSGPASVARALVRAPDGAAYIAGAASTGALAARYGSRTGRLDCSFGSAGRTTPFGSDDFDIETDGIFSAALAPEGLVVAGRRAGGGLLLSRLLVAALAAPPVRPRLGTLAPRLDRGGRGRGYAYGLVDGGCRATPVRFELSGPDGRVRRTAVQRVLAAGGPQVVCARLRGLRSGRRYRVRVAATGAAGPRGAWRSFRAGPITGPQRVQEGCV